jgi:hypothetical protein
MPGSDRPHAVAVPPQSSGSGVEGLPAVNGASGRHSTPPEAAVAAAAWDEALAAAAELRAALADLGLDQPFARLRGDVNVYGAAMVSLGRITPTIARQLAAVLRGFGAATEQRAGDASTSLDAMNMPNRGDARDARDDTPGAAERDGHGRAGTAYDNATPGHTRARDDQVAMPAPRHGMRVRPAGTARDTD